MSCDRNKHHRRSIRLRGYDYTSPGAYFVTICVRGRKCVLGYVADDEMVFSETGQVAEAQWRGLPKHYPHVALDAFVVMPNHVHGIIVLLPDRPPVGAGFEGDRDAGYRTARKPAPIRKRHPLSEIVRGFKTFSARRINAMHGTQGQPFWQRNYYERVIRNARELEATREYIANNPLHWELDRENPDRTTHLTR